ncbi:glycosyl hydrolase family 18 protein [Ferviditalea candida]|uniref:Glycosyl hydrolase family 18 protein n=1 Tax=Ferviditalea candida TaxID=3108399 RepID=A0ABU5ZKM2_9BACL|nr:glycosyl hydrolase family 18 protein [Paenibacillaceae bacterium T2]
MFKHGKLIVILTFVFGCLLQQWAAPVSAAADSTTKYRLYQNNRIIMEYSNLNTAIAQAKTLTNSHVEEISSRKWLWDNFPRYRIYQYDNTLPDWQFATLNEAIREAKKWANASIRDLQSGGWVWNNYPKQPNYRVYQGESTRSSWVFADLKSAVNEARKWEHSYVIDLNSNQWVWDNLSEEYKQSLKQGEPVYQIYIETYTQQDWQFPSLVDAIHKAAAQDGAVVINSRTQKTVYANIKPYQVYQNQKLLKEFSKLNEAIGFANGWAHASIETDGREIWTNEPYYQVYQGDRLINRFFTIPGALKFAVQYSNASIRTSEGDVIWDNNRSLLFWSWNGTYKPDLIKSQVSDTLGLDADSPTWFELTGGDGTLKDQSDADTVRWLHAQGIQVHPLVSNGFDSGLTSQFLKNTNAQARFISSLVGRAAQINVDGINIDFESISGKDREKYTTFVKDLAQAAHQKGLSVSIDLPRGDLSWNHLTAYDHKELMKIVDHIIIMAYDQHYSGSPEPGSVAGLPWTEAGIQDFLSYGIPRDKLVLGIPFYTRVWKLADDGSPVGNKALLLKGIPGLLASIQYTKTWDSRYQQYKITYQQDGYTWVFWLEDEDTLTKRLNLAKKYNLAGVAAWRTGHEYENVWKVMILQK